MENTGPDDADAGGPTGAFEDTVTLLLAAVGMVAIAVGFLGILLTDATLTDFDSIYAPLAVVGLACYVSLKLQNAI